MAQQQDDQYLTAIAEFGPAVARLAGGYEADPDRRRDLLQEIHIALWRSFAGFKGQCSMRTWVYRVAHNVATSYVTRQRRWSGRKLVTLEDAGELPGVDNPEAAAGERLALKRLMTLVHALKANDRQIMLLYLEDFDAAEIAEITGLSPGAVATKIHKLKAVLTADFEKGGRDGD